MSHVKEISVNVSKKLGRPGEFGSDMVSASITWSLDENDDRELVWTGAWAEAWKEANKQEEEIKFNRETKEAIDNPATTQDPIMDSTAPYCEVHHVPLTWHPAGISKKTNKPYPGFYACPEKTPDGRFCTFRPKQ